MRAQRLRIFVGCEGESEQAYVVCLNKLADTHGHPVHLQAEILRRGDPLTRIQQAVQKIRLQEDRRGAFAHRFALLDFDQVERDIPRLLQTEALARASEIHIIWQRPAHEGLLLKHFTEFDHRNPATTAEAVEQLRRAWPNYRKGLPGARYSSALGLEQIRRAGGHIDGLSTLLRVIALIP